MLGFLSEFLTRKAQEGNTDNASHAEKVNVVHPTRGLLVEGRGIPGSPHKTPTAAMKHFAGRRRMSHLLDCPPGVNSNFEQSPVQGLPRLFAQPTPTGAPHPAALVTSRKTFLHGLPNSASNFLEPGCKHTDKQTYPKQGRQWHGDQRSVREETHRRGDLANKDLTEARMGGEI